MRTSKSHGKYPMVVGNRIEAWDMKKTILILMKMIDKIICRGIFITYKFLICSHPLSNKRHDMKFTKSQQIIPQ